MVDLFKYYSSTVYSLRTLQPYSFHTNLKYNLNTNLNSMREVTRLRRIESSFFKMLCFFFTRTKFDIIQKSILDRCLVEKRIFLPIMRKLDGVSKLNATH